MNPFVSVHMIVKENTHLGESFGNGCFYSLHEAQYPNEIVLIDNGCPEFMTTNVFEPWKLKFKDIDCNFKIIKSDLTKFCDLRNLCLEHTNPNSDFITWQDFDEVFYPEDLDLVKNYLMPEHIGAGKIWSYFYHTVISPFQVQVNVNKVKAKQGLNLDDYRNSKDNIFSYNKNLRWEGDVHEHLHNLTSDREVQSNLEYMHYGYCKAQWRIMLKWLKYALLEFGHIGVYKDETIDVDEDGNNILDSKKERVKSVQLDYLRSWRSPDNIIHDRREFCRTYPEVSIGTKDHIPDGAKLIIGDCKTEADWISNLNKLDSNEFWLRWQDKYKEVGSWKNTLDWAVGEMEKVGWSAAW